MRTFKFRIWDNQTKSFKSNVAGTHCFSEWLIGPFDGKVVDAVGILGAKEDLRELDRMGWDGYFEGTKFVSAPRFVIQQFTGLFDRHDREIYEGDIIRFSEVSHQIVFSNVTFGYVIDSSGRHNIDEKYGDYIPVQAIFGLYEVELVGNIFQNPERLTK